MSLQSSFVSMPTSPKIPLKVPSVFAGKAWQQVLSRDPQADGLFVYAVKTTKIYCRPGCPSRRPERKNVSFYPSPEMARAAGFRPCLRCEPDAAAPRQDPQIAAIDAVSRYLKENAGEQTRLKDVAKATGVAPLTILRGFKRVLGVTPREFAKTERMAKFKAKVRVPKTSVTEAIYDSGFSSSSRLYESAKANLGMTPTSLRKGGAGEQVRYALASSPLGPMIVAATAQGVCQIAFAETDKELVAGLTSGFPRAELKQMDRELSYAVEAVLAAMAESPKAEPLPIDVRATAFQARVWKELQSIPRGETRTYSQVAEALESPRAVRAVAHACASNPLAVLVPCHRVIGKDGALTGYRWGLSRKRQLLEAEGALPSKDLHE